MVQYATDLVIKCSNFRSKRSINDFFSKNCNESVTFIRCNNNNNEKLIVILRFISKCQVWLWKLESNDRGMWLTGFGGFFFFVVYVRWHEDEGKCWRCDQFYCNVILQAYRYTQRNEYRYAAYRTQLCCRVCMSFIVSG